MNTNNNTEKELTGYPSYDGFAEKLFATIKHFKAARAITYLNDNGISVYSHEDLLKGIKAWQKNISKYGIRQGDRVAIIAPTSPNTIVAVLALAVWNITAVMIDPNLPTEEINRLLEYSDIRGILTISTIYRNISENIISEIPVFNIDCSDFKPVLFPDSVTSVKRAETVDKHYDVIAVLFSSGTTSSMKGIMITYDSILLSFDKQRYVFGLKSGEKYLHVLPLNHISGYSSLMTFLLSGCNIGIVQNVNATKLQKALLEFNPHYFGMVPKVYDTIADKIWHGISKKGRGVTWLINLFLNFSGFTRRRFGLKIGHVICKPIYSKAFGKDIIGLAVMGSVCKESTAKLFLNMGINWANIYGSTETSAPISSTGIFDRYAYDSVGKADQFSDISIKINNPDGDGIGEIYVKTPMIMKGYFRDFEATNKAFDNGYFKTGDLGYIDEKNYLHITGRSKESIILHNGEKVSAQDIDNFYQTACSEVEIACCSVTNDNGTDEVHIFVETSGKATEVIDKAVAAIKRKSLELVSIYSLEGIHTIDKIPVTSIGKVKRYLLKEKLEKDNALEPSALAKPPSNASIEEIVTSIIAKYTKSGAEITLASKLSEDLGLDSLSIFEVVSEISSKTNTNILVALGNVKTVGELIDAADNKNHGIHELDLSVFPHAKTDKDIKSLRRWIKTMRKIYNFEVIGAENVPKNGNFILCSNHINNLDPIWLLIAMEEIDYHKIGCLAAVHLFQNKLTRKLFNMIGAIPVDRSGNTAPALKRCMECLIEGYSLIIFPEGARTRDGSMMPFKNGAAELSVKTGKPIIPARIDGGFDVFPRGKKFPRVFDFKKMCKFTLKITFGDPIYPSCANAQEITDRLKAQINQLEFRGDSFENRD